jgi:hypothetical protein
MSNLHPRFASIALALFASLACACSSGNGGGGGGHGTGSSSGTGSNANFCNLASAGDVSSALSLSNVQAPTEVDNDPVTLCTYTITGKGEVLIRYETQEDDSTFKLGESGFTSNGMTTTTVTGIGDEAYSSTFGKPGDIIYENTLVVLKGSTEVEISAPGDLGPIETLAGEILAKL